MSAAAARQDRPALVDKLLSVTPEMRADIVSMLATAGSGHPGGSLSAIDIISTLFFGEMRHRATEPHWKDRDRFVLSKGHGVPALYATLAHAGYFPRTDLPTLRVLGSRLQGHPANTLLPGIEASTGSLGQGHQSRSEGSVPVSDSRNGAIWRR